MNKEKINNAVLEAQKFIDRANIVLNDLDNSAYKRDYCVGNKNSGALRRQSLELTNSLATLRK